MTLLSCLLWSAVGWAQEAPATPPDAISTEEQKARLAQAQELYRLGAGLYKAGRYQEAIVSFTEAYALSDNKKLLYNIANAQERLGDLRGAIESLQGYRPHAPSADRVSLDLRIASLEDRLAQMATAPQPAVPPPAAAPSEGAANLGDVRPVQKLQPRWGLVGGGVVAAGVGAGVAAWSWSQGQNLLEEGTDEDQYRTFRTINNVSLAVTGVGVAVAIGGLVPTRRVATVSAHPTGATFRVQF